jgi:translation initiation factor 2A
VSGIFQVDPVKLSPNNSVRVIDADNGGVISEVPIKDAVELVFSPRGTYLLTWERPKKEENTGNYGPNLKVWNASTGEQLESFVQKTQGGWSIQYTGDEKYCARLVTSGLMHFYESQNMHTPWSKLETEGIAEFSLSPGQNYSVAIFIPEKQGKPASIRVYQMPNFKQPVSQKTFFKSDKVQMKWNKLGTALLVLASTEVDQSGKSYYGETNLYLLGIAGSYDSRITLDKEGTIHDFAWSPNSREFGVIYGYMPAKTTIFDARGNVVHSLPVGPRNTIMFSPHARYILVAGFGNLQGTMDIYDRQKQFAKVTTIEASNTTFSEWSPDGRYILTATTSPRLRVDNGVKIWHVSGQLIFAQEHDELFASAWRPQDVALFPLRSALSPTPTPHESVSNATVKAPDNSKPSGAYRPPHARSSGVSAPTPLFQRAMARESSPRAVPGAVPGATSAPPGLSRTAAKNKKKREAKKANDVNGSVKGIPNEAAAPAEVLAETPAVEEAANQQLNVPTGSTPEDKKIRSLLKKLRAIEELKQRQAVGEKLEETQVQKITTEAAVRKELSSLGWVR